MLQRDEEILFTFKSVRIGDIEELVFTSESIIRHIEAYQCFMPKRTDSTRIAYSGVTRLHLETMESFDIVEFFLPDEQNRDSRKALKQVTVVFDKNARQLCDDGLVRDLHSDVRFVSGLQ